MAINWKLKTYLATKHGIYGAVAFQKQIVKTTGILISVQNLCNHLKGKPKSIRLKTVELFCTALECKLSDFCEVKPGKADSTQTKKLSYQNTPLSKRATTRFPDPSDYGGI